MPSPIPLFDPEAAAGANAESGENAAVGAPRIIQLYEGLELFSQGSLPGDPPANSLFVLGRTVGYSPDQTSLWRDQLLIIDPPPDLATRFRVEGDAAALYTVPHTGQTAALPLLQTVPGGVAHIRVGEHFLDIYSHHEGAVIHLPATGVLLGGSFGSDAVPPRVAAGSDGSDELDALRLIARLLKTTHFQLFIPQIGALEKDKLAVMDRLASDVAYLHGLRRIAPGLAQRHEPWPEVERIAAGLLPPSMPSPAARSIHAANLRLLIEAASATGQ